MRNTANRRYPGRNQAEADSWFRLIFISLIVIILIVAGGWCYFRYWRPAESPAVPADPVETAPVLPADPAPAAETAPAAVPVETAAAPVETVTQTPVDVTDGDPVETPAVPNRVTLPSSRLLTDVPVDEPIKGIPHPTDPLIDLPLITQNTVSDDFDRRFAALQELLKSGDCTAAVEAAERLLAAQNYASERWRRTAALLTRANTRRYLSGTPTAENGLTTYTIQPGDSLFKIAHRHGIPLETLCAINRFESPKKLIYPGDKLQVPSPHLPWRIIVSKRYHLLELFRGDRRFAAYEIGIGRRDSTPTGHFMIYEKIENPDYITRDRRIIPAGQPGNQLGSRWMRLSGATENDPQGYGIHGTPNEASVGKSLSNGCLRMRNKDLEELFLIIPTGTPVTIRE